MTSRPLAVIGNVNVDIIIGPAVPWPQPGTEALVDHGEIRIGGAAGNVGLTWDALRHPYQIAANTGDDHFGRWLREAFKAHSAKWPVTPTATTFSVGVTHPDGERTFFTIAGHMPSLTLAQVRGALDASAIEGGIVLVVGSYLTDALTDEYDNLFAWLREYRVDVALDTGWPIGGWTAETIARTRGWLKRCRHVLLNDVEAKAVTATNSTLDALSALSGLVGEDAYIVIKCGSDGAVGRYRDAQIDIKAPSVTPIDTIGAGDVFDAAYLAEVANGTGFADAVAAGIRTASRAIATLPRQYR
ncbi:carbohydrate kinase family protein [Dongia sp.]|uniref:carbohydrate kinase family protein n=1 Tax=Dongia sp. TaxID=1977262 RepID=UPI0035B2142D